MFSLSNPHTASAFRVWVCTTLMVAATMIFAPQATAANHFIVLFDTSGSMKESGEIIRDVWRDIADDSSAMAEVLSREFVNRAVDKLPQDQGFPVFDPKQDIFSFLLFSVNYHYPSYAPEHMFLSNRTLLSYTGGLPPAEHYESFDYEARSGQTNDTKELKLLFAGHSPLVAATNASLPFLADSMKRAGIEKIRENTEIDRTIIIRITDGDYNSIANASDEYVVIKSRADKARENDPRSAAQQLKRLKTKGKDSYVEHKALAQEVNRVFDFGSNRVDCHTAFESELYDCSAEAYNNLSNKGGLLISYIEVTPKSVPLETLARVENSNLELDMEYRYEDQHVHLVGRNPLYVKSNIYSDGLIKVVPTKITWSDSQYHTGECDLPDSKTGEVDCKEGNAIDWQVKQNPEEPGTQLAYPKKIRYQVAFAMRFPGESDKTSLYPFSRDLGIYNIPDVSVSTKPPPEYINLPEESDPDFLAYFDPRRLPSAYDSSPEASNKRPLLANDFGELAKNWRASFNKANVVTPNMVVEASYAKQLRVQQQETKYNFWVKLFYPYGLALLLVLGYLGFLYLPKLKLAVTRYNYAHSGLVLDFNHREHQPIALLGLLRVENPPRRIFGESPFKGLRLWLEPPVYSAIDNEGNSNKVKLELKKLPLAIGAPGKDLVEEKITASGKEFPVYFNPGEIVDIKCSPYFNLSSDDQMNLSIPVNVMVEAGKAGEISVPFQFNLIAKPETGRVEVVSSDIATIKTGGRNVKVEYKDGQRHWQISTYRLINTSKHQFSRPVEGDLKVSISRADGKELASVINFQNDEQYNNTLPFALSHDQQLTIPVVIDFAKLKHPKQSEIYRVVVLRRYPTVEDNGGWRTEDEWSLEIERSRGRTDPKMTIVSDMDKTQDGYPFLNKDQPSLGEPHVLGELDPIKVSHQATASQNKTKLTSLHLENRCISGIGKADWTATVSIDSYEGLKILQDTLPVILIDVNIAEANAVQKGSLPDSSDQSKRRIVLEIQLLNKYIKIQQREMRLVLDICVDWVVYPDGDTPRAHCDKFFTKATLDCRLIHEPPRDVLAIDFGTSATAIAHATSPDNINLLPLAERLREIEKDGIRRRWDDPNDSNHYFIASECNVSTDNATRSMLSPRDTRFLDLPMTLPARDDFSDLCFSSLKAMMAAGIQELPFDINRYPYLDEHGVPATEMPSLLEVLHGAYNKLLEDFVQPILKSQQQGFSRVYITHPNTYTQNHVQQLRGVVESVFNGIGEGFQKVYADNIHFFSESDAVASYYLGRAQQFWRQNDIDFKPRESILIYDIGAGTLDFTFLEVEWEEKTEGIINPKKISVKLRDGVAKAGDLLDECMARDLHSFLDEALNDDRYLERIVVDGSALMAKSVVSKMNRLRDEIHRLKKELSANNIETFEVELASTGVELLKSRAEETPALYDGILGLEGRENNTVVWKTNRDQLLNGRYVRAFIEQVTREEVHRFFGGDDIPDIDTVIISGRTSLWPGFRESLSETLSGVDNWVDFGRESDELKKAVVLGVIEEEFSSSNLRFDVPKIIGKFGVRYRKDLTRESPPFEAFDKSGQEKKLQLVNATTLSIGLQTNSGYQECFSFLPSEHWPEGTEDTSLTVKLVYTPKGSLTVTLRHSSGRVGTFRESRYLKTVDYKLRAWPLGVSKLTEKSPEKVVDNNRSR